MMVQCTDQEICVSSVTSDLGLCSGGILVLVVMIVNPVHLWALQGCIENPFMYKISPIHTKILIQRVAREVGGGIGMGNTCKPMAVSFQCMTKFTTNKKK